MYRASLLALWSLVFSGAVVVGQAPFGSAPSSFQLPPGAQNQQFAYAVSDQVGDVAQVNYQTTSDFVSEAEMYGQGGEVVYAPVQNDPGDLVSCIDTIGAIWSTCRGTQPHRDLLATPSMLGGGFGGGNSLIGRTNFQGVQQVIVPFNNAVGTLVGPFNGVNSDVNLDVLSSPANPDFASVGAGTLTGGIFSFNVNQSVPSVSLPPGATFVSASATQASQAGGASTITTGDLWNVLVTANQNFQILIPSAANAGSAVVGRTRVADNNSPLPRTRVYFNYDFLDAVPLTAQGVSVSRFTPGIEYAVSDCMSIEARMPFASTLSTDVLSNGPTESGEVEFGDFFLAVKKLLFRSEDFVLSGGCGVTLPSANDLSVGVVGGPTALLVESQAIHVMPFLSSVARLTERLYYQGFMQADIDVNGNSVWANNGLGLQRVGRVHDVARLNTSAGLGYWIRRRGEHPDAFFSAIAPTLELHWERSLESSTAFTSGNFVVGNNGGEYATLNLLVGNTFEITPGEAISLGFVTGIGESADQYMDGQLRVIWNRFF